MSTEDIIYLILLLICIPFGHFVKLTRKKETKSCLVLLAGLAVGFILVGYKGLPHSIFTVLVNYLLIKLTGPRICHMVSFVFVFSYLFFFRTCNWYGFPSPPPYSNALQLLVTLRTISVAFELHESSSTTAKKNEQSLQQQKTIDFSFFDYLVYCFSYIGLLTGPFYTYRTFIDMIEQDGSQISTVWPAIRNLKHMILFAPIYIILARNFPLSYLSSDEYLNHEWGILYQLVLLVPTFTWFRWRFYIAWMLAESMCMTAGLGAYPESSKPKPGVGPTEKIPEKFDPIAESIKHPDGDTHSFETIHNIDMFAIEFSPTMKFAMKRWNMTVQWWMATYVYKKMPFKSAQLRMFLLLFISAYWHGVYPGYYLTFLSVPLVVIAETRMINYIKPYLNEMQSYWLDWVTWFCLYRSFEYTGIGFMLLKLDLIWKVWVKMFFIGHVFIFLFILLPSILPRKKKIKETEISKKEN